MKLAINLDNKTSWGKLNELIQECRERDLITLEEYNELLRALDELLKQ